MSFETHANRLRAKLLGKAPMEALGEAMPAAGPVAKIKVKVGPEHYDFAQFPELREYTNTRWYYDKHDFEWNLFHQHVGAPSALVQVDGRKMVNYASYNYLDLAGDARAKEAAKQAIDDFGTSSGSGRINTGEIALFEDFEREISEVLGTEDAVLSLGGYATNAFTLGYLMRKQDLILYDELVHNSALIGFKLAGSRRFAFPHNDYEALERLLVEHRGSYERTLIVAEGVYSMDGDIPDVPRLIEIKKRHQALLMIDEAHSMGVIGPHGLGVVDHFGLRGADIDILYGSLSKAFASVGGYVAGSKELVAMLKHYAPGISLYTTSPSPASAAAALTNLRIMRAEPERARRLIANADRFRERAKSAGFDIGLSHDSAVVSIMLRDSELALWLSVRLFDKGIYTFPMMYPIVPRNAARLRFFISCAHTPEQIDMTIDRLVELKAVAPASKGLF